ncbi:hypothetical protein EYF80_047523 [Liparis tanakae]|uniref:Uncharacterized protein n=1 Tax=Liparis tanakae TaxID=230148 RepID=A0A4Z2FN94_9TELE|nr:hypothetical protein EYF80_047523 [Liparis tanakae]
MFQLQDNEVGECMLLNRNKKAFSIDPSCPGFKMNTNTTPQVQAEHVLPPVSDGQGATAPSGLYSSRGSKGSDMASTPMQYGVVG